MNMIKTTLYAFAGCLLLAGIASAESFWIGHKAGAGSGTALPNDIYFNTGRIITNLNAFTLNCTRTVSGGGLLYSISWTGSDFDGDLLNDTLTFDLLVEGFSGSTYVYSTTNGASSMTALGAAAGVTSAGNIWGVGGDNDVDAGQTLRFSITNAQVSLPGYVCEFEGFTGVKVIEPGGRDHLLIMGEGTGLTGKEFDTATAEYTFPPVERFVITGAGSYYDHLQWAVGTINYKFRVFNSADPYAWDVTDYSDFVTGPGYRGEYSAQQSFSNFPSFSWDTIPRWLIIRKNNPYTNEEVQSMATNYQMIVFEKSNGAGFSSTEAGILDTAARVRAVDPTTKNIFYWNSWIHYGGYAANAIYEPHKWEWSKVITDTNGVQSLYLFKDKYLTHNYGVPEMRDWWVNTALGMVSNSAIDGVFLDKVHEYDDDEELFVDNEGATGYELMLQQLEDGLPPGKLHTGNTLRNERTDGNRSYMEIMDGSYLERWDMFDRDFLPTQSTADATAVSIQLMREALSKGKIIMFKTSGNAATQETLAASINYPLALYLIVAETNAYFSYQGDVFAEVASWKWDTSWIPEFNRPLGVPLGPPVRNGYVYTRSYEFVDVWVDISAKNAQLTWRDVPLGTGLIGWDDFDGKQRFMSRDNSSPINHEVTAVWAIVNRNTVLRDSIVDTSLVGTPHIGVNTNDNCGFAASTKTDHFFAMYRAGVNGARTLTYTFDVAGYESLSLNMDLAASGDLPDRDISVRFSLDGGPTNTIIDIGSSTADWVQTMENGRLVTHARSAKVTVNGKAAAPLSETFSTYRASIAGTGDVLTVILRMGSSVGGNQGFGMDNLELYGWSPNDPSFKAWMARHRLLGSDAALGANPDRDRYSNEEEYIAGLDPTVPDAFEIMEFTAGSEHLLEWSAVSGRVYNIYWSSNLVDGFSLIESNVSDGTFSDLIRPAEPEGFYKISVELEP